MKKLSILFVLVVSSFGLKGQSYFAFYELRDLVQQTQYMQPAFVPNNSVSVSIPALNFGTSVQADFRLDQLLSKNDIGQFVVDFDVLRESAQNANFTNFDLTANLLTINIKTSQGAFSLFANSRATFDLAYGEPLLEFLANGNTNAIGSNIDLSDTQFTMNGLNEYGIGYANRFLNDRLTIGARVKLVQGIVHGSLGDDFQGSIHTNADDYLWTISVQNGQVNTAGFDYLFNGGDYGANDFTNYVMSNQNRTVAFDLGAKFKVLPFLELEGSVNDIGKIKWSEQVRNYQTADTTFTYSGFDLANVGDAENVLQDSLGSKFNSNETQVGFETKLGTRYYMTVSGYITPNDRVSLTYFKNASFSEMPGNYALSFNHRFDNFVVGAVGSYRRAHNEINFGASLASNIGPIQLYVALDNILLMNRPERYSKADFRFGFNLMFGYKKWRKDKIVDLDNL